MSCAPGEFGPPGPIVSVSPDDLPSGQPDWLEQQAWFLRALDAKFSQQAELIRDLLDATSATPFSAAPSPFGTRELDSERGSEAEIDIVAVADRTSLRRSDTPNVKAPRKSENIRKATAILGARVMNERLEVEEPPLRQFVKKRLDTFMGAVVFTNITVMVVMTQWAGRNSDVILELEREVWPFFTQEFFDGLEYVFYTLYLLDVILRAWVLRREWCYDPVEGVQYMNIFDASLVLLSTGELILLPAIVSGGTDIQANAVRLLKLVRIVRTLRIIKAVSVFRQLRVLVATCIASIGALIWSMILLVVLKVAVSLMAGQALQTFIQDESEDLEARLKLPTVLGVWHEMNNLYGSFTKAFYTFFEITHSGSWPSRVRPVLEKVSPWYSTIFLPYIALVVFAVIRVVTALFIKETLASAANDAEMVIEESRRMAVEYQERLEAPELFRLVDNDGDGSLSPEEFVQAMELPSVQQYLKFLEPQRWWLVAMVVTVRDCGPLFEILARGDGNGQITITEFCKGLMSIKGQARALDIVVLQHENSKLQTQIAEVLKILKGFEIKARQRASRHKDKAENRGSIPSFRTTQVEFAT
eukprot:Skav223350  [mRNA]  locus=scaffold200:446151:454511:+ [translate_table: standard]